VVPGPVVQAAIPRLRPHVDMSSRDQLTKKQRALKREIEHIVDLLDLDYQNIKSYDREHRTPRLEIIKDHIIRSYVVSSYTLVDEFLGNIICQYYFGPFTEKRGFMYFWRTKRFQRFNYYILERLSLPHKLDLVKEIRRVPTKVSSDIMAINDLRNALAHAFFPENLRRYRPNKPAYKGKMIFTLSGLEVLVDDVTQIYDWYFGRR
jgi:hypothetical protein